MILSQNYRKIKILMKIPSGRPKASYKGLVRDFL